MIFKISIFLLIKNNHSFTILIEFGTFKKLVKTNLV